MRTRDAGSDVRFLPVSLFSHLQFGLIWLESNSHYVPQSGPELLGLKDPPDECS